MIDTNEWDNGAGNARVNKVVGEAHLRKFGKFVEDHVVRLQDISDSFVYGDVNIFPHVPVTVLLNIDDPVSILDLTNTDNKVLNKIIAVLASLCIEARERTKEANMYYTSLLVFGEEIDAGGTKALMATSKFLPRLQDIANFVERCHTVIGEFLQQLSAIYITSQNNQIIHATNMHFEDMMQHLGDLLVILVTLDALVDSLENIKETWALYKRLIPTVQMKNNGDQNKGLASAVTGLENAVLAGRMFRGALDNLSGWRPGGSSVGEELQLYIRNMLVSLESKETGLIQDAGALFLRTSCVLVLTATVFGLSDKRLMKQAWEVARNNPSVSLAGPCMWHPDEFFAFYLDHLLKPEIKRPPSDLPGIRTETLNSKCKNAAKDLLRFSQETCNWSIQIESVLGNENIQLTLDDLKRRSTVFLGGAKLANEIRRTIKLIMNSHTRLGKPMTRSIVLYLCALIELLAAIEQTYLVQSFALAESVHHVTQFLAHGILNIVQRATQRVSADKACTRRHLDALSALLLVQSALSGPASTKRILVSRLALSIARGSQSRVLKDDEVDLVYAQVQQLDQLSSLQTAVKQACDSSYLYFQRVMIPMYLEHAAPSRLPYMLRSMSTAGDTLSESNDRLSDFENMILEYLESRALRRWREDVETNLRLQVHAHLQQERPATAADKNLALRMPPLQLFYKVLNMRSHVESYLDTTFYNLTTVALHDWRSYGQMRALARVQLSLSLVKDCLPCQTLEQGLDVLEVIRSIHVFVAAYQYNMNNQLFVERESPSKHLNTIGIRHVSNSIRTHGTGIVNTTVNFIYQFLRNKFFVFSQFLFDEQIKSRLAKDVMAWRDSHAKGAESYQYERTDKFVKGIRKLGVTDGLSYLDQFRILITQIGNAMGYVRLVRSGGMHACSNSLSFLPESETEFENRSSGLSKATIDAAQRLDHVVRSLAANFADGSNYFRLLTDVFAADFRNSKHSHLNNFYIIVPPLTISFVEHMLAGKEKVLRRKGGVWTDDGFAMGLAYVLTLLDQHEKLASLHWFASAKAHHRREPSQLSDKTQNTFGTNLLTAKRLEAYIQEFDLLSFGLNSAKIFFKKQSAPEPK